MNGFRKLTASGLIAVILLAAMSAFFIFYKSPGQTRKISGGYVENSRDIPEISLMDQHGKTFTKAQLKGHWTFLFFGFTHCPMICPSTFDALNQTYQLLEKKLPPHLMPQVVFISIDPERDTIERLNQYVNSYNSKFIGTREKEISARETEKNLSRTALLIRNRFTHNTDILLINPKAEIQAYFYFPQQPENLARVYQQFLDDERRVAE